MKLKRTLRPWRQLAFQLIEQFERGGIAELTLTSLAAQVGVSRVTIWRDSDLTRRLASARESKSTRKGRSLSKSDATLRISRLQMELDVVVAENSRLIECLVRIFDLMHRKGLDPHDFIGAGERGQKGGDSASALVESVLVSMRRSYP